MKIAVNWFKYKLCPQELCEFWEVTKTFRLHFLSVAHESHSVVWLCDPMDHTVHGILQVRILEWVAFSFSRGSSQPRDQTWGSHIAGGFFLPDKPQEKPTRVFPGGSDGKSNCLQGQRPTFNPWVGKIPWRRKRPPTPVLLPWKSHGQRSLVGYSPWGHKESDTTEQLHFHLPLCGTRELGWIS